MLNEPPLNTGTFAETAYSQSGGVWLRALVAGRAPVTNSRHLLPEVASCGLR